MEESLASLCEHGAKIVRLDAFGYATKKPGTRCFFEVSLGLGFRADAKLHGISRQSLQLPALLASVEGSASSRESALSSESSSGTLTHLLKAT